MQPFDNRSKPLDQLGIAIPEFIERLGLLLKYAKNLIRRVASIDGGSQWVVAKILSGALGILGQGFLEEGFEVGSWGGHH